MKRHYVKTYGVREIIWKGKKRFCVVCDGRHHPDMNYAKRAFALKEAKCFCRNVHVNFTDFQGNHVTFEYIEQE